MSGSWSVPWLTCVDKENGLADFPPPALVKWIVAILWREPSALQQALDGLVPLFGPMDFQGPDHPFNVSTYYDEEMGPNLVRRMVSFEPLARPDRLAQAKRQCIELEDQARRGGCRVFNLDVGYLDHNKIVLGSIKPAGQKIYLGQGIYADLMLRFRAGAYQPFEWTMKDFRDGRYTQDLLSIRALYLRQMRNHRGE